LFAVETQVDYAIKSLFKPLLDQRFDVLEVKRTAEEITTQKTHQGLAATVFAGDCSNWYIGKFGRNAASWPGYARTFWMATYFPDWQAFNMKGGSRLWPLRTLRRWLGEWVFSATGLQLSTLLIATLALKYDSRSSRQALGGLKDRLVSLTTRT
jgi:hypothetical protein